MFDINRYCREFTQQCEAPGYDDAYDIGRHFVEAAIGGDPQLTIETSSVLTALNNKPTLAHESAAAMIAGVCAAVFEHDIAKSPEGFFRLPNIDFVMENCGMGGDTIPTPNISCLAAVCAASAGIMMVKHGSRSHTNPNGSTNFFESCGMRMDLPKSQMMRNALDYRLGYIDAVDARYKRIHQMTMQRSRVSHLSHIVGPITSPVDPKQLRRRVIGINQNVSPRMVAEVYRILNERGITYMEDLFVVRGLGDGDGKMMDEASLTQHGTEVARLKNGSIEEYRLHAHDFGMDTASAAALSIPEGRTKGEFSLAILEGRVKGPALDLVCANAALLFHLADPSRDLAQCATLARTQFESGAAYNHIANMRKRNHSNAH